MKKVSYFKRLGFKLTALFTIIVFVGSLIGGASSAFLAKQEFNTVVKEQFYSTIAITENLITMVGQLGLNWANHFVTDYELIKQVKSKNESKLHEYVIDFLEESRADSVILIDKKGQIIFHSAQPSRKDENISSLSIVKQAKQNFQIGTSIVQDVNNLIIYSSGILKDGDEFVGAVLIGFEINDQFISNIKTNTHIDITIVRRRAVMASTFHAPGKERLNNISIPYILYQSQLNNPQSLGNMNLYDVEYFTSAKKLTLMEPSMEGSILLSYPKAELNKIWAKLVSYFLGLFVFAIVMVTLISYRFSNTLLKPLKELQKYTNDILSGKSDDTLRITSTDEIGVVSENVNQLVTSISKKNFELDAYSNNLEDMVEERTKEVHLGHEKLEKKEIMLSRAQLLAHMGSCEWELGNDKVTCSEGIYKLFNLDAKEFDNKSESFLSFFHDDDHKKIAELAYLKSAGEVFHFDARIKPKGYGYYINVHVELEVEVNEKGMPVRILGTLHDVTEQKKYEKVLKEIAEGVSTIAGDEIFNTLTQYIANTLNLDNAVIGLIQSPDFEKIKTISFYSQQKHIENIEYYIKDTPCSDVIHDISYIQPEHVQQVYPKDDRLKTINAEGYVGVPISDSKGEHIGLVYILNETPLQDSEKILSLLKIFSIRIAAELERKENEYRLLHAQKMDAIGQLTGGVAHDFNNILASILGFTELMQSEESIKDNEKLQGYLEQVYSSGARARDLVRQMLAFVHSKKIVSGEIILSQIINQTINLLRATIPQTIEIITDIEDENQIIQADSIQLQQTIMNLVINARDAIDNIGKITIATHKVSVEDEQCNSCLKDFSGDWIKISVHDTGKGISEKVIRRIFDPFYTTKRLGESTGMGLSVVHGIVHANQGHITIISSSDSGTTFNLFYPPG